LDDVPAGENGAGLANDIASRRTGEVAGGMFGLQYLLITAGYLRVDRVNITVDGTKDIRRFYQACGRKGQAGFILSLETQDIPTLFDAIKAGDVRSFFAFVFDGEAEAANYMFENLGAERQQRFLQLFEGVEEQKAQAVYGILNFSFSGAQQRRQFILQKMSDHAFLREFILGLSQDAFDAVVETLREINSLSLIFELYREDVNALNDCLGRLQPKDLARMLLRLKNFDRINEFIHIIDAGLLQSVLARFRLKPDSFRGVFAQLYPEAQTKFFEAMSLEDRQRFASIIQEVSPAFKHADMPKAESEKRPLERELDRFRALGFLSQAPRNMVQAMQLLGLQEGEDWHRPYRQLLVIFRDAIAQPHSSEEMRQAAKALSIAREIMRGRMREGSFVGSIKHMWREE